MVEGKIIDRGRGPEIAGTRITVYDVLDYHRDGWHRDRIASLFRISSRQVEAALRYIEEHRDEVMADYQEMRDRDARGNPPQSARGQAFCRSETRTHSGVHVCVM